MINKPFELRIVPGDATNYGLAMYRQSSRSEGQNGEAANWPLVVRVHGVPMRAVIDQVLQTVKQAGYCASDLARSRKLPFQLTEEQGVRLGLLLLAVKPLRKTARMTELSEHVQSMTSEEAYYWFSKVTDARQGRRSQKALRILLARE